MLRFQNILVPYDFDDLSAFALDYAVALGERLNASITLLHVVQVRVHGPHATPYPPPDLAEQVETAAGREQRSSRHVETATSPSSPSSAGARRGRRSCGRPRSSLST